MNQDKTQIYPTTEDIHGMDAKKPKKITYEEIQKMIEATKKQYSSTKDRIPELESSILSLTEQWRDAVVSGESEKTTSGILEKLTKLEKQLELLESINVEKEIKQTLSKNKALSGKCQEFEEQEKQILERLVVEAEKLTEKVKSAHQTFLDAAKERRAKMAEIANICMQLDQIHQSLDLPLNLGGTYHSYKARVTNINYDTLLNKIRIAAGQHSV